MSIESISAGFLIVIIIMTIQVLKYKKRHNELCNMMIDQSARIFELEEIMFANMFQNKSYGELQNRHKTLNDEFHAMSQDVRDSSYGRLVKRQMTTIESYLSQIPGSI